MLSETTVRGAKPGTKPYKLSDGGGLFLLVQPNGTRLWRLAYRFGGAQKALALGAYPVVRLADARAGREAAKRLLAEGVDPSAKRKADRAAAAASAANTFKALADEEAAKFAAHRSLNTQGKRAWLISLAAPLHHRPIREITATEILAVLQKVERTGRRETARRLRSTIGNVFRYAISTARAENDPTVALRGALAAPVVTSRPAITAPTEFGALLRAIEGFKGQPTTRAALKLMAVLFPRPGELRAAAWAEFDLEAAVWTIPAERMKMRRPHRMPLPRQALDILRDLQGVTGGGRLLFPSLRSVLRPISENTLNGALRRLGYARDEMVAHGFRATASTLLNESGLWSADAIERQLAHVEANAVRRAYARGDHWQERVAMAGWWADYLDQLRANNVVPLSLADGRLRAQAGQP